MKIAFLYMGDVRHVPSTIFGPIGIAYIASHIEKYGGFNDLHLEVDVKKIIDLKPDIVGIGSYTDTYPLAKEAAREIKRKLDIPVILGGPHTTSLPHVTDPIFDVATVGEAEDTFLELLQLYQTGNFKTKGFEKIKSLVYHQDGELLMTPRRPDIIDLDYFPAPKRELLKYTKEGRTYSWNQHIHSSRGCPYDCVFCAAKKISGKVRYHSPEQIILQIQDILSRFNQPQITFSDDLFTLNVQRMESIAELIEREKLNKYCTFTCCVRANRLTDRVCQIFQRMNMRTVCFGFESGDDEIIKYLKAHNMKVEHNREAIQLSRKYDLKIVGNFIIGSPPETVKQLANTYWFVFSNRRDITATYFCHATPFPLIPWWDDAVREGLLDEQNINWQALNVGFNEHDSIFMNKNYSKEFFKEAYQHFKELEKSIFQINSKTEEFYGRPNRNTYLPEIYKKLPNFIEEEKEIMIISRQVSEIFIREVVSFNEKEVDFSVYEKEFPQITKNYDLIFLDHCLELLREPETIFSQLKPRGKILLLIHNPIHIANLIPFLLGKDLMIQDIYHTETSLIQNLAKQNFSLKKKEPYKYLSQKFMSEYLSLISFLLSRIEEFPFLREYDVYSSYLLFERT